MNDKKCRFCNSDLEYIFADLGMAPLSNSYITKENLNRKENFYPLCAYICEKCFLVQLMEYESPEEIFTDYAYFSSYSKSWLEHAKKYSEEVVEKLHINHNSQIIEIASNDGYLLQFFHEKNIPVLGIEPAKNVASEAEKKGIKTINSFFGKKLALELRNKGIVADLLIGNNVLAHVPDINDFVEGLGILLDSDGYITMEFPHLLQLIKNKQFDTIYHEHFSYFSLNTVNRIFESKGLKIVDVEALETHGGSIRIYAKHAKSFNSARTQNVDIILNEEIDFGLLDSEKYMEFNEDVKKLKRNILEFLIEIKDNNKTIVAYGAPAKGNTLLNYCGIRNDFIDYTVDLSLQKQGLFLPGSHIPIYSPDEIYKTKPDYILILPWNIKDEIILQMKSVKEWGAKFVTLIPEVRVI